MANSTFYTPFLAAWLAGFTVCLSLIVSIGAQNLYVLRQAVHSQHVRACVAWCVVSDALLIGEQPPSGDVTARFAAHRKLASLTVRLDARTSRQLEVYLLHGFQGY